MIIAFSFNRIIVNVFLIMINILFTETEISSKNAEQAQYRVNRLLPALTFFTLFVLLLSAHAHACSLCLCVCV